MTTDENEQEAGSTPDPAAPAPAESEHPAAVAATPSPDAAPTAADASAPPAEAPAPAAADASAPPAEARAPADRPPGGPPGDRPQGDRPPRRDAGDGDERPRRRHFGRRRVCIFCADKVKSIDYKDASRLRRFLSDRARIEPRRKTGTCAKHQRWLATALKRARHLALLPYTPEHIRLSGVTTGRGR